jgi:hypothetical protein
MICRNGGLIGAITNGGFAEYIAVPARNVFKIPDDIDWGLAASLPVTSLTPYHALKEASLKVNEFLMMHHKCKTHTPIQKPFALIQTTNAGATQVAISNSSSAAAFGLDGKAFVGQFGSLIPITHAQTNGQNNWSESCYG